MIDYVRHTLLPSKPAQLMIKTVMKWLQDNCLEMGAALSYYAIFSLFPVLLVILSVTGFLLGPESDAFPQVLNFVDETLPPGAVGIVEDTLTNLNQDSVAAGAISFVVLLFTASSVFGALDRSIDRIWQIEPSQNDNEGLKATAIAVVSKKLVSFALVLGTAALLLLSLLSTIIIRVVMTVIAQFEDTVQFVDLDNLPIARLLQLGSSTLILALAVLLLLRFLPSTHTPWKDVWPGALLSTVLLLALQQLVSNSVIEIGAQYSSYGVIGGVMILMMWIYLTFQIFFLGCEFSYIYAYLFGSRRNRSLEL
ncbi:YihY/virulence factor BrkB family protein [Nodosilinea sp. P-1105]|uniref:YihY/virulence factor BrkB family protein n=1 Tax=Nodosilinea sp. P-1105 TaxID=2546229 RepID=UPI00146D7B16|nr:YihY/virulence factor BrkB family protein [Nodosilinea sp. P-1105]NMF81836.1 YihY/virulence factor BrkB family protein [Nodosilinea sp. P-1105]